ncbi:MAG: hypothetical protein KJ757_06400 [Planctomycetes bacterium]|nr:hypothetical protein [Planctomycetota bacterium]
MVVLEKDLKIGDKRVVLTNCIPELSLKELAIYGSHSITLFIAIIDQKIREMITMEIETLGKCQPLIEQRAEAVAEKVVNFIFPKSA